MSLTTWMLAMLACGALNAWLADRKGYSVRSWFWLGTLLGLVSTLILCVQPSKLSCDETHPAHAA